MQRFRLAQGRTARLLGIVVLVGAVAALQGAPAGPVLRARGQDTTAYAAGSCNLGNGIQHVIYVQFDNVHFRRDLPNVPSDLEQMPHLLGFLKSNGVVLSNHHTPLISHTSEDILTSLTGVYPDRHGVAVGQNSYDFYTKNASSTGFTSAFTYWTDTIGNGTYNMLSGAPTAAKPTGTNAPAPWVPYTRAGCDVGGVASANQVLENNNVNSKFGANDIGTVYGASSPEAQESPTQRTSDFVGIAVHCSLADSSSSGPCSPDNHGRPDVLPDEPGGYSGYNALFGHKYVAPLISPSGLVTDLNGSVIKDAKGNVGFPGFDGTDAATSLGYVAAMQEHGIPVTYAYISDAHDLAGAATHTALGPGEQTYVQQLQRYDQAFGKFFSRLQTDGITKKNTLFVFTSDENDHYTGGVPTNLGCTGATIDATQNPAVATPGNYCLYTKAPFDPKTPPGPPFGEVAAGLDGLLARQGINNYTFDLGNDTAPTVYLKGQPTRTDPSVRTFERATGAITVTNPITQRVESLVQYLADPVEMGLLHIVTADPTRTPTFTAFARPDYYVTATCSAGFTSSPGATYSPSCLVENPTYAYLHGNVQPDVTTTWLGMAGPGVQNLGVDNRTWSDHTDIRPTMMALLGLKDDYAHDGRVLYEDLNPSVLPAALQSQSNVIVALAKAYKQIEAPVGEFGLGTLQISTGGLQSGSAASDPSYASSEALLLSLGAQRDGLKSQMIALLENAEFNGATIDPGQAQSLINASWKLIQRVTDLSGTLGFEVDSRSSLPGQSQVLFGTSPDCAGLNSVATQDQGGGTEHHIFVTGNDLAGTVGDIGIIPGTTYWYETVTTHPDGTREIDNNGGRCYSATVPGP